MSLSELNPWLPRIIVNIKDENGFINKKDNSKLYYVVAIPLKGETLKILIQVVLRVINLLSEFCIKNLLL